VHTKFADVAKQKSQGLAMASSALEALRAGRAGDARDLARRALTAEPRNPNVLHAVGELALQMQDVATASDLLGQAIECHAPPAPAAWHLSLAQALVRVGKLDAAARSFRVGLETSPGETDAWLGLARALHGIGDLRGAIEAWQTAISLVPTDWKAFNDMGSAWMEMRDWERAQQAFAQAESLAPWQAIVAVNRSTLLHRSGQSDEAVLSFEACVKRHPDYPAAVAGLGFALRDVGRFEEAVASLRRAVELAPHNPMFACGLGRTLLEAGSADEALAVATSYLERRPDYSGARALEALARIALGDAEGVNHLLDYPRFVSPIELGAPEGFASVAAFNSALATHAAGHRTLMSSPISHATKDGLHSGSLLIEPRGPIKALEHAIGAAIGSYWRALSQSAPHPFTLYRPQSVFLKMWTVVLERGGHQIPHIHPEAWLSGVYYPQLPRAIREGAGPAGWLEFGDAERSFPARMKAPIYQVRPREGLLVLFPSYFYHRTIPFDDPGTRISIAFDVVPVGA
jgi:tetratricopeptide (TPR) repeat protein